jgi:hypothetical protein
MTLGPDLRHEMICQLSETQLSMTAKIASANEATSMATQRTR